MALTPDQRAHWEDIVAHWRGDWGEVLMYEKPYILAVADHLVALDAQVAEARRLLAQYVTPFDPQRGATDCLSCGGDVSTGMFEDFWTAHTEDCPVGAFLAATAPHGAGEATG